MVPGEQRMTGVESLDASRQARLLRLAGLAAQALDAPAAVLAFSGLERYWVHAPDWPMLAALPGDQAFHAHVLAAPDAIAVSDARCDPRLAASPLVTGAPGIRFCAGVPLLASDQARLGTLCVMAMQPRRSEPAQLAELQGIAELIVDQLELHREAMARAQAEATVAAERERLARRGRKPAVQFLDVRCRRPLRAAELGRQERPGARMWASCRRKRRCPRRERALGRHQSARTRGRDHSRGDLLHPRRRGGSVQDWPGCDGDEEPAVRLLDLRRGRPLHHEQRHLPVALEQPYRADADVAVATGYGRSQPAGAERRDAALRGDLRHRLAREVEDSGRRAMPGSSAWSASTSTSPSASGPRPASGIWPITTRSPACPTAACSRSG